MSSPKAEKRRQSRRFHITDSKYCTSSELISLIIYSLKLKSILLLKHSRLTVIKSCKNHLPFRSEQVSESWTSDYCLLYTTKTYLNELLCPNFNVPL